MAFVEIKDWREGWNGTDSTVTKAFTVTMDDVNDTADLITEDPSTPSVNDLLSPGSQYRILPGGINCQRINGKILQWRLFATYTKTGFAFSSSDDSDRLISFDTTTRTYTHTAMRAREYYNPITDETQTTADDEPDIYIRNSVADTFDPSDLQDEYYNTVLNWTQREERDFDYIGALQNRGSLNKESTTILGVPVPAGNGLFRAINPQLSTDENGDFEWICTYSVEIAEDEDFWLNILDRGYYAVIDGKKKEITNADIKTNRGETPTSADFNTPASEPQLLDGQGGLRAWNPSTERYDPVYLRYRTKKYKDWEKTLNLIAEEIRTG